MGNVCRTYGAPDNFGAMCTQGFRPGLGVCRAYGAGYLRVLLAVVSELVVEEIG